MNRSLAYYGWKPDFPDQRDFKLKDYEPILADTSLPVDLRNSCPPVYDQGPLGSCTANAIAGAFQFELMKQSDPAFTPSRLFIYYNERVIENSVNSDSGASIRDGMNSVSQQGVCNETEWPYIINEFTQKPYQSCYTDALNNIITSYYSLDQDLGQMKSCLASGYPFIFGFTAYESLDSDLVSQTGILNMPGGDESVIGGHAVVAVGYNDVQNRFIVRNSWGPDWGMNGYFTIPYAYLLDQNLSSDFWTIRLVSDDAEASVSANQ
ncbi:MAG TPA: C1 family peptidase [Mucilaginibacter sp.]|jgi:C1A family cysteine protease|nr:C1 family peptidase [Mucilaginibacter sp.]